MASLTGRNVLVTGAGGFIGSHLVEWLVHDGANVRALVHYNSRNDWGLLQLLPEPVKQALEVVNGDVQDPFFVRKAVSGCTVVFHLASPASLHPRTARVPVPLIRPWGSGSAT